MTRLLILLLAGTAFSPALAQHEGHGGTTNPHAGHGTSEQPPVDPHAGHAMPSAPEAAPLPDPHAGHGAPAATDQHAGHGSSAPETAADPHAGLATTEAATPPVAPPPPGALAGPAHAADAVWGEDSMAPSRDILRREHGDMTVSKILLDRLEWRGGNGQDGYEWDIQAWHGGDIDKIWLKSEGDGAFGEGLESAEIQALWSHAIDPWFDLQAGLRQDFGPGPDRTYAVLGMQGLAPYWFEIDGALFLSDKGEVSARAEAEYDLRITQRLILQPRAEADVQLQDVPARRLGSGLSTGEIGLRLRYEIEPQFAPYVGVAYERAFGDTADLRGAAGEVRGGWNLLLGIRAWF
jgi:copper resistance protein B